MGLGIFVLRLQICIRGAYLKIRTLFAFFKNGGFCEEITNLIFEWSDFGSILGSFNFMVKALSSNSLFKAIKATNKITNLLETAPFI